MAHESTGPPFGSAGSREPAGQFLVCLRDAWAPARLCPVGSDRQCPISMMEPLGMRFYRAYGVPWIKDDIHEQLKEMSPEEIEGMGGGLVAVENPVFSRAGTAALLSFEDSGSDRRQRSQVSRCHGNSSEPRHRRSDALRGTREFCRVVGLWAHHMLTAEQKKIEARLPDEALYALALYIQSLEPPPNPNTFDENSGSREEDLRARRLRRLPHAGAVHEQQTDSGNRVSNRRRTSHPLLTYFRFRSEPIPISR